MGPYAISGHCLQHHMTQCKIASSRNPSAEICSMRDYVPRVERLMFIVHVFILKISAGMFVFSGSTQSQWSTFSENASSYWSGKQIWEWRYVSESKTGEWYNHWRLYPCRQQVSRKVIFIYIFYFYQVKSVTNILYSSYFFKTSS